MSNRGFFLPTPKGERGHWKTLRPLASLKALKVANWNAWIKLPNELGRRNHNFTTVLNVAAEDGHWDTVEWLLFEQNLIQPYAEQFARQHVNFVEHQINLSWRARYGQRWPAVGELAQMPEEQWQRVVRYLGGSGAKMTAKLEVNLLLLAWARYRFNKSSREVEQILTSGAGEVNYQRILWVLNNQTRGDGEGTRAGLRAMKELLRPLASRQALGRSLPQPAKTTGKPKPWL